MTIQGFLDGLRPVPNLTVDEWADANRVLASESSAEPGPYRTSRAPYLRQIMVDMSPNTPIQKVVVMKSAQVGFSEAAINIVGCYMDISPCPIGYVMPTIEGAMAISKDRIDPMIANCESLLKKVPAKGKEGGNTIQQKNFPGGRLFLMGANSAVSLRSRAIRLLPMDEVDAYPIDLDGEGSPVKLAEQRTNTFGDRRKMMLFSTPTVEGQSVIARELAETEIHKYHVPCPECGVMQDLKFEQLKWDEGDPESVRYECEHCAAKIEERHKTRMLALGAWVPTYPEKMKATVRGYHINALYSPYGWFSWARVAENYEEAKIDPAKMKTFVNTVLGETYKEEVEAPEWERLYERREAYKIGSCHKDIAFLTAGADVQRDRIEVEVVGWCRGRRSYSVDYRVLLGDTTQKAVWNQLRDLLGEVFWSADGRDLRILKLAVDSGYNTQFVYDFQKAAGMERVMVVKGSDTQELLLSQPREVYIGTNNKKLVRGVKLYTVGVSLAKKELYNWLRLTNTGETEPDGYCHFPQYGEEYFRGITAEVLRAKEIRGYKRHEWVKVYKRNEPLDCRVYARAAAAMLGMDRMVDKHWDKLLNTPRRSEAVIEAITEATKPFEAPKQVEASKAAEPSPAPAPVAAKKPKQKRSNDDDFWRGRGGW